MSTDDRAENARLLVQIERLRSMLREKFAETMRLRDERDALAEQLLALGVAAGQQLVVEHRGPAGQWEPADLCTWDADSDLVQIREHATGALLTVSRRGLRIKSNTSESEEADVPTSHSAVVCICGSMRFEQQMREAAIDLSLIGVIVLLPLVNMKSPDPRWSDNEEFAALTKFTLDKLHLAKIDLADEILVVAPGGYIGDSTRREIAYAQAHGKPIRYMTGEADDVEV